MPFNGKAGPGRPRGRRNDATLAKEAAREVQRALITAKLRPLTEAQIDNAMGVSHFMLRDAETGQWQRLTDADQIQAALNAPGAAEGSTFYIYTKDPSIQAFTDLMNRALDKPKEQPLEVIHGLSEDVLARLDAWKLRNRKELPE